MKFKSLRWTHWIFSFWLIFLSSMAQAAPTVWEVLYGQFKLDHGLNRPEVQHQIRWIIAHPSYIQKLTRQSEPYIYHIITEIRKRNLPGEIALLPMIESSYDPFAYSGAGAAGLWQLMPGTGTDLGLKRDWWSDGRRSIGPSTNAALNYLAYLNEYFNGDWILAFAAYDSGEGTMSRIIKNSGQSGHKNINFWNLNVPQETRAYVPRLLALAEVIQNPERYHVVLPDIPHVPYFEEVNIGSQIDLNHAAKLAGISYHDLIKLNPGYNRWATAPYRPYKLLIPAGKVRSFTQNLAITPENERVSLMRHQVSAGDNLMIIAERYHTTVNLIKELNQLKTISVKKGQFVLIPSSKNVSTPAKPTPAPIETSQHFITAKEYKLLHIVQKQDSFAALQKKYGVTEKQIQFWNHMKAGVALKPGQQLLIWKPQAQTGVYIVKNGDNLSRIAQAHNTTTQHLLSANPTLNRSTLKPGQSIILG